MNSIMQEASSLAKAVEQAWIKAGKPQKFSIRVFEDAEKNFLGLTTKPAKIALLFEKEDILFHKGEPDLKKRDVRPSSYTTPAPGLRNAGKAEDKQQRKPEAPRSKPSTYGTPSPSEVRGTSPRTSKPSHYSETTKDTSENRQHTPAPQHVRPVPATPARVTHPASARPLPLTTTTPQTPALPAQHHEQAEDQEGKSRIFWTDEMVAVADSWLHDALAKMDKKDHVFTTEIKRYHLKFSFKKPLSDDPERQKNLFRNFSFLIMQTVRNRLKKQLKYHKIVLTSDQ